MCRKQNLNNIMLLESPILSDHPQKDYLEDIKAAINNVDSKYYNWYNHKLVNSEYPSENFQKAYCERVFAYELYHQIRRIMDVKPTLPRYKDVYLNGETVKDNKFFKDIYEGLAKLSPKFSEDKDNKRIPDLVLHKDLGSIEEEGQIYLAEIKMADNKDALDDLDKLSILKKSKLNFSFYIFIYAGKNVEDFKTELSKIDYTSFSYDIVCLCSIHGDSKCMTLGEIIAEM